jgi:hypothetical protein
MKNKLETFVEMCSLLNNNDNKIYFPFETFEHSNQYSHISNLEVYPFLKNKMIKLIEMINNDNSLLEKDIENELWPLL